MRRTLTLALVAAALALTAACAGPGPTESRRPDIRRDGDPQDTVKKCGGMIGSGTFTC
jgi:hypothetical protein